MRRLPGFFGFCYDFLVGDDWTIALAVVAGLAITYGLSRTSLPAWWALPTVIAVALPVSLWRAVRGR